MFYVYIMLDQRKKGRWVYNELEFDYQPFYVGIGRGYRMTSHFTPYNLKSKSIKNNIIKSINKELNEYPIFYKIYNNITRENACEIEIDIIKHFGKIKDDSGILSNLTDGGEGSNGLKHSEEYKNTLRKKVYQYSLDGKFIKKWNSLKDVVDCFEMNGGAGIRYSMKTGGQCKGYLWSYEKVEFLPKHVGHKKNIYLYTIEQNGTVKVFNNYDEINSFFGKKVSPGNISSCCNGKMKHYLGYTWKREKNKE